MMTKTNIELGARTVYGEARNQSAEGMLAVAHTILRRIERDQWPDEVSEVVLQPKQYSAWNPRDPNFKRMVAVDLNDHAYQKALFIFLGAALGFLKDPTNGADHYHAKSVTPFWANEYKKVAEIGDHIFYNSVEEP